MTCTSANTVSCGNKLVTVFAAPYLDSLPNTDKFQSSNNLHHRNAIPKPAAHYFANTAPCPSRTGTVPGPNGTGHKAGCFVGQRLLPQLPCR